LTEHRNITRKNGQPVLRSLDERQTKPFSIRSRNQASTCLVDLVEKLVASLLQPKQLLTILLVRSNPVDKRVTLPTMLADDNQLDFVAGTPQSLESIQYLNMTFAWLQRAHHQEAGIDLE